jgi:hypothetical protein
MKILLIILAVITTLVTLLWVLAGLHGSPSHVAQLPVKQQLVPVKQQLGPEVEVCVKVISTKAGRKYGDRRCAQVQIGMDMDEVSNRLGDDRYHPDQTITVQGGQISYWHYFNPAGSDATPILLEFDNQKLAAISQ